MVIDWSALTNPRQAIELIFRKEDTRDVYQKNNIFQAVALTPGYPLTAKEAKAMQMSQKKTPEDDEEGKKDDSKYFARIYFKGRILGPNSPHSFLPDPCDPALTTNATIAQQAVALHTTFVSTKEFKDETMVNAGDIFTVALRAGDDDSPFNLHIGDAMYRTSAPKKRIKKEAEECESIADMFKGGSFSGGYTGPPCDYAGPNRTAGEINTAYAGRGQMSLEFAEKIVEVADAMGTDPGFLANQLAMESGFAPDIINTVCEAKYDNQDDRLANCAVGLIQFMPETARGLDTTSAELYTMTAIEQMTYVQKYYGQQSNTSYETQSDLYATTFLPASRSESYQNDYGYGDDFNIYDFYEDGNVPSCDGKCYSDANPGINTIGEYASHANANAALKC